MLTVKIKNNIVNYPLLLDSFSSIGSLNIDELEEKLRLYKNIGWKIENGEKYQQDKNIKSNSSFKNSNLNTYFIIFLLVTSIGLIYLRILEQKNK